LMGGLGPLMNGPAISAIDGWAGPTIFSGPLINGPYWRMGQNSGFTLIDYRRISITMLMLRNLPNLRNLLWKCKRNPSFNPPTNPALQLSWIMHNNGLRPRPQNSRVIGPSAVMSRIILEAVSPLTLDTVVQFESSHLMWQRLRSRPPFGHPWDYSV